MWTLKIRIDGRDSLLGSKALRRQVDLFLFPVSFVKRKDAMIVHLAGTIFGSDKDIRGFLKDLKGDKWVIDAELNRDFLVCTIKEPRYLECIYNEEIIHIEPSHISRSGFETGCIGSFDRKALEKTIQILEKRYAGEVISIQNRKIRSISLMRVHPELTAKQKAAITLAIKEGYYSYPRRIDVQDLAKIAGLSFSTFQVHLRKAEGKLMPHFLK